MISSWPLTLLFWNFFSSQLLRFFFRARWARTLLTAGKSKSGMYTITIGLGNFDINYFWWSYSVGPAWTVFICLVKLVLCANWRWQSAHLCSYPLVCLAEMCSFSVKRCENALLQWGQICSRAFSWIALICLRRLVSLTTFSQMSQLTYLLDTTKFWWTKRMSKKRQKIVYKVSQQVLIRHLGKKYLIETKNEKFVKVSLHSGIWRIFLTKMWKF